MPNIEIEIEIRCATCGATLDTEVKPERGNGPRCEVDPCEVCIRDARDEAHNGGHTDGYDEGIAEAAIIAHELRTPAAHYAAVEAMCIAYRAAIELTEPTEYHIDTLRERVYRIARTLRPHVAPVEPQPKPTKPPNLCTCPACRISREIREGSEVSP